MYFCNNLLIPTLGQLFSLPAWELSVLRMNPGPGLSWKTHRATSPQQWFLLLSVHGVVKSVSWRGNKEKGCPEACRQAPNPFHGVCVTSTVRPQPHEPSAALSREEQERLPGPYWRNYPGQTSIEELQVAWQGQDVRGPSGLMSDKAVGFLSALVNPSTAGDWRAWE